MRIILVVAAVAGFCLCAGGVYDLAEVAGGGPSYFPGGFPAAVLFNIGLAKIILGIFLLAIWEGFSALIEIGDRLVKHLDQGAPSKGKDV